MSAPDSVRAAAVERVRARLLVFSAEAAERVAGLDDPAAVEGVLRDGMRAALRDIGADLGLVDALDVLDALEREG